MGILTRPERIRPNLAAGEQTLAVGEATMAGTGRIIGIAAAIGGMVGLLYATTGESVSLVASVALGGFAGVVVGYLAAFVTARQKTGPGAITMVMVMTNQRLLLLRRSAALRSHPLKEFTLGDIAELSSQPTPVGQYHRLEFSTDHETIRLLVRGSQDFKALHREHTSL